MAANNSPIFPLLPKIQGNTILTADAIASKNHDGTTTNMKLIYTAGENGADIKEVRMVHIGTNIQTVVRFFINNGSDPTVADNNLLFHEITMSQNTISETTASVPQVWNPTTLKLPPNGRLYALVGTTIASGIRVTCFGGDF